MSKYEELKKEDSRIGQTLPEHEGRKPIKLRRKQPHEISGFGVALLKFVGGIFAWFIGAMFVASMPGINTFAVYMVLGLLAIPVGIFFRYFTFNQEVAPIPEVEAVEFYEDEQAEQLVEPTTRWRLREAHEIEGTGMSCFNMVGGVILFAILFVVSSAAFGTIGAIVVGILVPVSMVASLYHSWFIKEIVEPEVEEEARVVHHHYRGERNGSFCTNCGSKANREDKFCASCGAAMNF